MRTNEDPVEERECKGRVRQVSFVNEGIMYMKNINPIQISTFPFPNFL